MPDKELIIATYHAKRHEENPLLQTHTPITDYLPPRNNLITQQNYHASALIPPQPDCKIKIDLIIKIRIEGIA